MWKITPGTTSYRGFRVRILDATTGAPYTGATSATAGASFGYTRTGGTRTSITLSDLAAVDTAYASGGINHIAAGWYVLHLPDAAIAAGVDGVLIDGSFTAYVVVCPPVLLETTQTGDSFALIGAAGAGLTALATASALATAQTTLNTIAAYIDTEIQTIITNIAAVAAAVWSYASRTLTQSGASVTAAVTGSSVTVTRGTLWTIPLTGLTDFTGYTALWFGVKANGREDADTASICLVKTTTGLIAFDGDDTITAGHAAITVNSSTSITITVEADATQYAAPGQYEYGIKALNASGKPFMVSSGGVFNVVSDIPMAIS